MRLAKTGEKICSPRRGRDLPAVLSRNRLYAKYSERPSSDRPCEELQDFLENLQVGGMVNGTNQKLINVNISENEFYERLILAIGIGSISSFVQVTATPSGSVEEALAAFRFPSAY